MSKKHVIGIDLGGTFIKAGMIDTKGRVVAREKVDTCGAEGVDAVIRQIALAAASVQKKARVAPKDILGVGIGAPGTINIAAGVVTFAPNLPGWRHVALCAKVQDKLKIPTLLENDANAAAYGEKWVGAGTKVNSLVMFTLGTGIGGGIIINNEVLHGVNDAAAELGHMTVVVDGVRCGCGNRGCVEAYASVPGMVRRMKDAVMKGKPSRLAGRIRKGEEITGKDIHAAAVRGDKTARAVLEETGMYLGIAAVNMMHIVNPAMIVFAGGMIAAGDMLMNAIKAEIKKRALEASAAKTEVVFAKLGDDAGMIGSAGCALRRLGISA
jgi:glucokinase